MTKLPDTYTPGQEYIGDETTQVILKFYASTPCVFWAVRIPKENIDMYLDGLDLIIEYRVDISRKLLEDIGKGKSHHYVWAYFNKIVPIINFEIQKSKYQNGQILCRPISMYDLNAIEILIGSELVTTVSPILFNNFPRSINPEYAHDCVYIRDYIDAMTAYLYCNYEECIRKSITSIENFFLHRKIKKKRFKETLSKIMEQWDDEYGRKIIYDDICYIYDLRNKIVHNTLRINYYKQEWQIVCHMGLGALWYFFQHIFPNKQEWEYIHSIAFQFQLVSKSVSSDLCDRISNTESLNQPESLIENKKIDINKMLFNQMIISEQLKQAIEQQ